MAYPTIAESGGSVSSATSQDIPLGTWSAGDLLVVAIFRRNTNAQTWTLITDAVPGGDTSAFSSVADQTTALDRLVIKRRVMVAGDHDHITVTTASGAVVAYTVIRVSAWAGSTPLQGTAGSTGSSSSYDCNSISVSAWGSCKKTFLVIVGGHSNNSGNLAMPSGYTGYTTRGSNPEIRAGYKQSTATSDDPANVTGLTTAYYAHMVLAVQGGEAYSFGRIVT
jgi:hypothetical protein